MYTRKSPHDDYVAEIEPLACETEVGRAAITWCKKTVPGLTFGKAMDVYLDDDKADQRWAVWSLRVMGDKLDDELRKGYIAKIVDPMMSFYLYLKMTITTVSQDSLIEAKFRGKLPRAERELADGTIQREKDKTK